MSAHIRVPDDVKTRLDELKPYETLSYGEFIAELVDRYEDDYAA